MKKITIFLLLMGWNSFAQVEFITDVIVHGVKVNNKMVFMNNSPEYGKELWVSDGTAAGTKVLKDINAGSADSTPYNLTLLDDVVYFQANSHQIWRTDGTINGTYKMVDNNLITNPFNYVKTKDFIFFYAGASGFNCCKKLWRMNLNPNSENLVTPENNFVSAEGLIVFDYDENVILFNAKTIANEWAIWRTNGGVSLMVKDLTPKKSDAQPIQGAKLLGSEIYFSGFTTEFGSELWKTDGTLDNTKMIKDIYVDENYFNGSGLRGDFIKIGANLYFTARDNSNGIEVWKTDGSESGTQMIKDVNPGNNHSGGGPGNLTEFNGLLYFTQSDSNNSQIWKTNGTETGTVKVINIPNTNVVYDIFFHKANLYFGMETPETGTELWKLDNNDNATFIRDIFPGTEGSFPGSFFELNGDAYFTATNNGLYSGYGTYKITDQSLTTNKINENAVFIYPNPTTGMLNIPSENKLDINIYDLLGKNVGHFKNQKTIDISNLKSGIYLLKSTELQTDKTFTQKIIKK